MGGQVRFAALWTALSLALGCRAEAPVPVALAANPADAGSLPSDGGLPSRCAGPALPLGDLTFAWTEGGDLVHHLELRMQRITRSGVEAGRVAGCCIFDAHGRVLRSVDAAGVVAGENGERVAALVRRDSIRSEGETVRLGYLMTGILGFGDGALAMSDSGGLFLIRPQDDLLSLPGDASGDVIRAKRTALVLWEAKSLLWDEGKP